MPVSVVSRADEILRNLELVYGNNEIVPSRSIKNRGKKPSPSVKEAAENGAPQNMQLSMFQLDDPVLVQIRDPDQGTRHQLPDPDRSAQQAQRNQEDNRHIGWRRLFRFDRFRDMGRTVPEIVLRRSV